MGIKEDLFGEACRQEREQVIEMPENGKDDISLGVRILVEHTQQSLVKASSYRKVINTNDSFNSSYKNTSGSLSGKASAGFGLFSASVDAAFKHVTSNVSSLKTLSYTEESSTTEFNPNFLQIIREVTNEAMINGEVAKTVETKIVDSTPIGKPLTPEELQKKSEDYIKMYDDGSGNGLSLGSICSFSATRQIQHTAYKKQLELCSYGYNDPSFAYWIVGSFIKIDGREAISSNSRGFTLATITSEGNLGEIKRYDTWGSDNASIQFRDYLRSLPDNTQLAGITYDSYDTHRATFHTEVRPILTSMGVDVSSRNNRNSLCFFLTKGKPELTKQNFAASGYGPATMKCSLSCT